MIHVLVTYGSTVNNCVGEVVTLEMTTCRVSVVKMLDPSAGISARAIEAKRGKRQIIFFMLGLLEVLAAVPAEELARAALRSVLRRSARALEVRVSVAREAMLPALVA